VGDVEVVGQSGVLHRGNPKGGGACPPGTPNPSVGEECQKAELDTVVEEDVISLDLSAARILPEVMAVA
jgi:hypothetical protein